MAKTIEAATWLPPELYPDCAPGQYRTVPESGDPLDGDLVVWVNETPDDLADGSGHFELYEGDVADYNYVVEKVNNND